MNADESWDSFINEQLETNPEFRTAYQDARRKLDAAWEVECRYGNCVVFVSPDSNEREDLGGWGPVGCPCEGEPGPDATEAELADYYNQTHNLSGFE